MQQVTLPDYLFRKPTKHGCQSRIYQVINSKHMPLFIVTAAGNYITTSPTDLRRLLGFPRLGLVIIYDIVSTAVLCVMFNCKNNNWMCQKNSEPEAGQLGRVCY